MILLLIFILNTTNVLFDLKTGVWDNQSNSYHDSQILSSNDITKTINASSEFEMWNIPAELKKPTKGFPIISVSLIQERMAEYQRMQRLKEREKKKANRL